MGIPVNYLYKSLADIDRFNIKLRNETIDWSSKFGQLLEQSLLLTEDEKQFGLLKAALELRNFNFVHKTILPAAGIFGLYVMAQTVNGKLNLYQKPRPVINSEFDLNSKFFNYFTSTGKIFRLWHFRNIHVWVLCIAD